MDDEWDGCPHGVIEGRCWQCAGMTKEQAREHPEYRVMEDLFEELIRNLPSDEEG